MSHDKLTCDLCKIGREDLCKIREKSVSEFHEANIGQGLFKDPVFRKQKQERKLPLRRTAI